MANNSYFDLFENIQLNNVDIKDIFDNIRLDIEELESNNLLTYYKMKDGETPQDIANRFYNDKKLYWLVLLTNEMYDYFYDFPLSDKELKNYMSYYYEENDNLIENEAQKLLQTGDDLEIKKNEIKEEIYQNFYTENDEKKYLKIIKSEYIDSLIEALENRD